MILLWSCGGGAQQQVQEEKLAEAQESVTADVQEMKRDINERVAYLDEEIEASSGELQEKLQAFRAELEEQQEILDGEIERVENASLETWESVLDQVTAAVIKAREKTNEVSREVREMLDE